MKRYAWKPVTAMLALGLLTGGLTDGRPAEPGAARLLPVPANRVQADLNRDRLFDDLAAELAGAPPHQPFDVILRYRRGHEGIASRFAGRVARGLPQDRSVAARLTAEEIRQLASSDAVESIEKNGRVVLARDTACASFGVTKARADFGLTGNADGNPLVYSPADMTIAVIDTGIDAAHPDLVGKVIGWQDFIAGRRDPYDEFGHGTHVASIAAGRGGVAPGASLVGLRVAQEQETTVDLVVAAIDWCVAQRERLGIDVVNLSLSMEGPGDGTDAQSRAVERAVAAGLVVCVAAGNIGPGYYTIGGAGTAVDAITVGNMLDLGKGGFALRFKSSRGPTLDGRIKPDLCAPGTAILAAKANSPDMIAMTGTSMASAFAAGVAALIRQTDPTLTPVEVKLRLATSTVFNGSDAVKRISNARSRR